MSDTIKNATNDKLVFEDPPPRKSSSDHPITGLLVELRKHPETWAKIGSYPNPSVAYTISGGKSYGAKAGEFETRSRKNDDGEYDVFARYVNGAAPKE